MFFIGLYDYSSSWPHTTNNYSRKGRITWHFISLILYSEVLDSMSTSATKEIHLSFVSMAMHIAGIRISVGPKVCMPAGPIWKTVKIAIVSLVGPSSLNSTLNGPSNAHWGLRHSTNYDNSTQTYTPISQIGWLRFTWFSWEWSINRVCVLY